MTVYSQGIPLKKQFGQHFLRDQHVVDSAVNKVFLDTTSSVFEIGCGDGFLTRTILKKPIARLWVFEIDPQWVAYIKETIKDDRLTLFQENILDVDFSIFEPHKPWVLLANLPYQITFPILYLLHKNREMLQEAVIMVQEEVAQKLVKTKGRGYGFPSLFFRHFFEIELMQKIPPGAFLPPPKVFSRLVYLKPKKNIQPIKDEQEFCKFIKFCFAQPRRTLRNNLQTTHYDVKKIPETTLSLRAQQMNMEDFLKIWDLINANSTK
jgi:16S rRNA (adenine1518-N6/adenine1519-N6)-dimethyltransferase